jgi:hypothetical protein
MTDSSISSKSRFGFRFVCVMSVLFMLPALGLAGVTTYRYMNWSHATGTVTNTEWTEQKRSNNGGRNYDVSISYHFKTDDGLKISGKETVHYAGNLTIDTGDAIGIYYVSSAPEENMTRHGLIGLGLFALMFGAMSVFCAVLAVVLRVRARRQLFGRQ